MVNFWNVINKTELKFLKNVLERIIINNFWEKYLIKWGRLEKILMVLLFLFWEMDDWIFI